MAGIIVDSLIYHLQNIKWRCSQPVGTTKTMVINVSQLLKHKIVNGWNLLWLITVPISVVVVLTMIRLDLSQAEGVSSMIQLTVRCAVPCLYVAFAASSIRVLFPGIFSRWILRNRRIIGLCFALAMAWQLLFILWLVSVHTLKMFTCSAMLLREWWATHSCLRWY